MNVLRVAVCAPDYQSGAEAMCDAIRDYLQQRQQDGLVAWQDQQAAAERFGCSLHAVELLALKQGLLPLRYQRNRSCFSTEDQLILCSSRVAIVGCGGLGGHLVELLARLGIGFLRVIDPDCFTEHNLNRQLLADLDNLGTAKVLAARQRVSRINPAVQVEPVQADLAADNARVLLQDIQVAVDALDNATARLTLAEACRAGQIPLVHGAVAGWYGQIAVQMPGPDILPFLHASDGSGIEQELGTPSFTPAVIAALQAALTCRLLLCTAAAAPVHTFCLDLLHLELSKLQ